MTLSLLWFAPLALSLDRFVAAIDLVGLGAALGGAGACIGPVLLFLTSRRSSAAATAATDAAIGRRELADEQAAQIRTLTAQVEMQQRLVLSCPVQQCPVRDTLLGAAP